MVIRNELIDLLASKVRLKILYSLWISQAELTLRQIADLSGLRLYSIQRAIKALDDKQLIILHKAGRSHLYRLNTDYYVCENILPVLFKDYLDECLKEIVKKLQKYCASIYLFGSYARKEQKPNSDLDIALIIDDAKISMECVMTELANLPQHYGLIISPYILSIRELKKRHREKNELVCSIVKTGKYLFGKRFSQIL